MMTRFTLTPRKTATLACLLGLGFGTAFGTIQANAAETAQAASYTKLELTASGSVQAPPDQLAASFRAESRSNSAAAAQKAVNTQVSKAAEQAKQANGVKYAISHYSVSEMRDDKAKNAVWTASQDLTFTAPDGEALLPLTGQLQANGLILEGLDWSLSPDKQKALQLEAEKAAVTDLKNRLIPLPLLLGCMLFALSVFRSLAHPTLGPFLWPPWRVAVWMPPRPLPARQKHKLFMPLSPQPFC